jgi:hypothetical protein
MYSGADTLTGGFPHSEIRGSTIARISPQLIAACHVLHRLLAPRHPPNALIALIRTTHAHTQDQAPRTSLCSPNFKCPATTLVTSLVHAASQPTSRSRSRPTTTRRDQPFRFTCQTTPPPRSDPFWGSMPDRETCRAEARARPPGNGARLSPDLTQPSRLNLRTPSSHSMETVGIEPTAPCLQSRCSTTELRPRNIGQPPLKRVTFPPPRASAPGDRIGGNGPGRT